MRRIEVTTQELAYRNKHGFDDVNIFNNSEIKCASCGKQLYIKSGCIFSHPLVGLLQCKSCWNQFKIINDISDDEEKYCYICGSTFKKLYECSDQNCESAFCKSCIKRNTTVSLWDAKNEDWKCFACEPKPLWELRAICAAVMDSLPKKGNWKNTHKIEKRVLPSEKEKLLNSKKIQRTLYMLCDKDDNSSNSDERPAFTIRSMREANNRNNHLMQTTNSYNVTSENEEDIQKKVKIDQKTKLNNLVCNKLVRISLPRLDSKKMHTTKKINVHSDSDEDSIVLLNKSTKSNIKMRPKATKKINRKKCMTNSVSSKYPSDSENDMNSFSASEILKISNNLSKQVTKRNKKDVRSRNTKQVKYNVIRKYFENSESEDENLHETQNRKKRSVNYATLHNSNEDQKYDKSMNKHTLKKSQIIDSDSSSKEFQKKKLYRRKHFSVRQLEKSDVDDTKALKSGNSANTKNEDKYKRNEDEQPNLNVNFNIKEVLSDCKSICLKFQKCIEMAEQLNEEDNNEKLVLTFAGKINKLTKKLREKQKILSTISHQLSSKKLKSHKDIEKESHGTMSDSELSPEETNVREEQEESKVSECDSDEIFSASESSSPQKIQKLQDTAVTSKTNNLNDDSVKSDDDGEILIANSEHSDTNNKASQVDLVPSPIISTSREKCTVVERSSKQPSISEGVTNTDNKERSTDKSINIQSESTTIDINTEPSALKELCKQINLHGDAQIDVAKDVVTKDFINESIDLFNSSFDEFETMGDKIDIQKMHIKTNSIVAKDPSEAESSKDDDTHETRSHNEKNDIGNIKDIPSERDKTSPILNSDEKRYLSLSRDNREKVAVLAKNNENINDLKKVDVAEKVQINDNPVSIETAEALAKKALLESDLSDTSEYTSHDVNSIELIEKSNANDTQKNEMTEIQSDASTLILFNDEKRCNKETDIEVTEVKERSNKLNANYDDEITAKSSSEDEDTKAERAAKQALLADSDNSLDSEKQTCEEFDEVTKWYTTIANFKEKKARLASSDSSSDTLSKKRQEKNKRKYEFESDNSTITMTKRKKLTRKNHYINDKKIRLMKCEVHLTQLDKTVLKRYSHALEKSKQYLEHKALYSLINLDNLEKRHNKNIKKISDTSTDSDSVSAKVLKSSHKGKEKQTVRTEESLMDHLMKVEDNDDLPGVQTDSNFDESIDPTTKVNFTMPISNEALMSEANRIAKRNLLNSSESDAGTEPITSDSEATNDDQENMEDKKKKSSQKLEEKLSKQDENKKEKSGKNNWRRDKLLTGKFSDTDSEIERKKWEIKQEKLSRQEEKNNSNSDDQEKRIKLKKQKKKIRRRILDSDSDIKLTDIDTESSSDASDANQNSSDSVIITLDSKKEKNKQKRKRHKHRNSKSSDTDSSFEEKKPKPKRRRIKKMTSDSDSSDTMQTSQGTPGKSGRKNIRKVLKDKQVADDTKQAAKEEDERLKRIAERQALYNEMYEMRLAGEEKVEKLVLDFDIETKEELVKVHEELVKRLKPHQAEGIKFMWDACFESLERIKTTPGSGCIIAHCMGLGKTLQVIALTHTLLTYKATGVKTILVVCPLSTVLNWTYEYETWLKNLDDDINVYELTKYKKNLDRKYQLHKWHKAGGVLIIGYEMFRNLTGSNKNIRKGIKEVIMQCLIDPGPDLIVCDEGHLLKNEDTALSKCMKNVKTMRRIVLTGTPLQNNLIEYHCMVQFVKPNLLGTRKEFLNRFVNPITNGQFDDSTAYDVKLMKKRAHVLHKMLEGSIQRFDYSVLTPFLPPKQEYVIFVRLTDTQIKMYQYYLANLARRHHGAGGSLFADFQTLQRIWTHPIVLRLNAEKLEKANEKKYSSDSEGSLKDFINDDTTDIESSTLSSSESTIRADDDSDVQIEDPKNDDPKNANVSKRKTKNNSGSEKEPNSPAKEDSAITETDWWSQFVEPEHYEDMRISAKLLLLFGILKECEQIGDKMLVFSQSLYSLTLIEKFLEKIDDETQKNATLETLSNHNGSWSLGLDYFRLDGQTSAENRTAWCQIFNKPTNTRARLFLISTRAGGLGINLTAANRVVIFDASWNPSHDVQSIFRIYRFGQKKPCYVYRFLAARTMEEKIYNRQVTKLSLSCRVVDEQQIERHYSNHNLNELYTFEPYDENRPTLNLPKDRLLAEIFLKYKDIVENYHEHDSLLENKAEEELDEEERQQAWLEYQEEKKGKAMITAPLYPNNLLLQQYHAMMSSEHMDFPGRPLCEPQNMSLHLDYENLQELIRKDFPNATLEQQKIMTNRTLMEMYNYWESQAVLQPPRNPVTMMNFQPRLSHGTTNSNVTLLNQLLSTRSDGNHVNVRQPMPNTNIVQNPLAYRNIQSNSNDQADVNVVEVTPSTSNINVQPSAMNKNQEE